MEPEDGVSAAFLSKVLGLTIRRIRQLAAEGVIQKAGRGRYPLAESVQRYIGLIDSGGRGDGKVLDYHRERTRLTRIRADVAEVEERERRGLLIPAPLIERAWTQILTLVRQRILALPDRAAARLQDAETIGAKRAVLKELAQEILEELSGTQIEAVPVPSHEGPARSGRRGESSTPEPPAAA